MAKSDTPSPAPAAPAESDSAFVTQVQEWINGKGEPSTPNSKAVLDDLKRILAEREEVSKRGQEAEKALRQAQAQATHLAGKIEGLVGALERLEAHAAA